MKNIIVSIALAASMMMLFSACNHGPNSEKHEIPATVDGLWVNSLQNAGKVNFVYPAYEVNGESVKLVYIESQWGHSYLKSEVSGTVTYDRKAGTGEFVFPSDSAENFTFTIGATGFMCSSKNVILVHYDRTAESLVKTDLNLCQKDEDFVGVSTPNSLYNGGSVTPALKPGFIDWVAEAATRAAVMFAVNQLFAVMFETEEGREMQAVLDAIDGINDKLDEMTQLFRNTNYEKYINERSNEYVAPIKNYTEYYYTLLKNCDGSDEAIGKIALEWGDGVISGNKAVVEFENFIDFLTDTRVEQKQLYQVYDLYVYNTTPWEKQGYPIREALRSCDAAVIAQSAFLATMYYIAKDDIDKDSRTAFLKKVSDYLEKYDKYDKLYPVVHHDDLAICQIKDVKMAMDTVLVKRDYYNKPWYPNGSEWDNEYNDGTWFILYGDTHYQCNEMYDFCLSPDEARKIAAFYKDSGYKTIEEILAAEAGIHLPKDAAGKTPVMLLQCEGNMTHDEYDDYWIGADSVLCGDLNPKSKNIGVAYLEHYGFLWMKQRFSYWTSKFDKNNYWYRTQVKERY